MKHGIWVTIKIGIATLVLCGIIYPLVVTGIGQLAFNKAANGSLVERGGTVVASTHIGQQFTSARYFEGRPTAAPDGYAGPVSGGSNLSMTSKELARQTEERAQDLRRKYDVPPDQKLPVDALTASASGVDPDISVEFADLQAPSVARARDLSVSTVRSLIKRHTAGPTFGIIGETRVNVVELNLALDDLQK